jgi:hypothetical protein
VTVTRPGEHAGAPADAAVTAHPGAVLVIRTADCAPVALLADGALGLAHVGWRGLVAGVVEATVGALRALGGDPVTAHIGPCIGPAAYEFGSEPLDAVAERYGDGVRARTAGGAPALDLAAGVREALARAGVAAGGDPPPCTATNHASYFSHRARREAGRQATFAWLEP